MNGRVWLGGLVLSLCGWAGTADAQEVPWGAPAGGPFATLGRPVAAAPAPIDPGVVTAAYHDAAAPVPVSRTGPDAVDGPDAAPEGLFASDPRPEVRPAFYATEPIAVAPQPGPAAADAPAPGAPAPGALATVAPEAPPACDDCSGLFGFGLFDAAAWPPRFYARGEYLLWRFKNDSVPPLVTTGSPADRIPGALGQAHTQLLFGGDGLSSGSHSGGRFTAGVWLDDCETKAVEVSGFFLPGGGRQFTANSAEFPVIARPFFSLNRNKEYVQLTAFPGISTGNVTVRNSSSLWGVEADLRCRLCCGCVPCDECECDHLFGGWDYHVDGLAGFRYLNLREDLRITENLINLPTAPMFPNTAVVVFDDFATRNQFYGGQVGLNATFGRGPWSLDVAGKLALGDTHQQVVINGGQLLTPLATGVTTPFQGGLLALRSNIGTHDRDAFSVVPEVNLNLSYHLNDHWRVFAGYDFLYWTNVVRPGQQIDRQLDETLIPNFDAPGTIAPAGQNRPAVLFRQSDFWAQGLNVGLEFRY